MSSTVLAGEGTMPLSEDEQRRLDEMERALQRDDPKFAAGQSIERIWLRRTVAAGAAVLIGMALLFAGIVTTQAMLVLGVIIGVIGFLCMVAGAALFTRRPRR
jgi:hypothetical protein